MRIKYEGKFKEDLNEYINNQPWMFELDGNNQSFWELPICMQWGVVLNWKCHLYEGFNMKSYTERQMKRVIDSFQEWYNDNK